LRSHCFCVGAIVGVDRAAASGSGAVLLVAFSVEDVVDLADREASSVEAEVRVGPFVVVPPVLLL